jgi:transcriptional regulator with GAF, ATPase, and Fis domain
MTLREALRAHEARIVAEALQQHGGAAQAARVLGVNRTAFHEIMRRHGLRSPCLSKYARRGQGNWGDL